MPYFSPISYGWYRIEVTPGSRDAATPTERNVGPDPARPAAPPVAKSNKVVRLVQPRLGVASQVCSAAVFLARALASRVRRTRGMARVLSIRMQRGRLKSVQCAGGAAAPLMGNDGETVGTHAAHPIGHGH